MSPACRRGCLATGANRYLGYREGFFNVVILPRGYSPEVLYVVILSKVTAQGMVFSRSNFFDGLIFCTNSTGKFYVEKFKISFTVAFAVCVLGFAKSLFFLLIFYANELLLVRSR